EEALVHVPGPLRLQAAVVRSRLLAVHAPVEDRPTSHGRPVRGAHRPPARAAPPHREHPTPRDLAHGRHGLRLADPRNPVHSAPARPVSGLLPFPGARSYGTRMQTNLARLAEEALDRLGDHPSLCYEGVWHTTGQLHARAQRVATGLRSLGV